MKKDTKHKKKKSSTNLNSNSKSKNKKDKDNVNDEESELKKEECHSLYKLLNVSNTATKDEIVSLNFNLKRKSYKILAMTFHPDKNKDENAAEKFKEIGKAYNILMDDEKRNMYDEFGTTDDFIDIANTYNFFRDLYPTVDFDAIEEYEKKYIGSSEELDDLIEFYNKFSGNMTCLLEHIPFSKNDDVERFSKCFEQLFSENKLVKNKKYETTIKKVRKLVENEVNEEDFNDLKAKILENKKKRMKDLDRMEKEYKK